MTFKYIGKTGYAGKATARRRRIQGVTIHHAATTNEAVVKRMFGTTAYEVSANAIGTERGMIQAVPETLRAWTSGSKYDGGKGADWDHKHLTVEAVNSTGAAGGWQIAEGTYRALAEWVAWASTEYGFPINRDTVIGHRELWERYRASFPTQCPGGIDLDRIVADARAIQNPTPPPPPPLTPEQKEEADLMAAKDDIIAEITRYIDERSRTAGVEFQIVVSGRQRWLQTAVGRVPLWGADQEAVQRVLSSLSWAQRDGAAQDGRNDAAWSRSGPEKDDYDIFDLYVRAAAAGQSVENPTTRKATT